MDPTTLRDTLLEYTIRTLWAVIVVAIALVLARAVRRVTMRRLTKHRAQGNATILLGNLAQLAVIVLGILVVLAIYTQGAFGWILTSFSVRSEEHTSELQSHSGISYAVFCLKKKKTIEHIRYSYDDSLEIKPISL